MVQGFVVDAALGMAAVVSGKAVAASMSNWRRAEHAFPLFEFIQTEIEEAGLLAIHERDRKTRMRPEKQGQRFQMELAVDEQLRSRQLRRQIELAPEIAAAASKHCAGAGLIAVQILRELEDAMQIGAGAAVLAALLCLAQRCANQIFGENGLFAMRFVLRSARFEIETESPAPVTVGVELGQLTDLFAGNHRDFSCVACWLIQAFADARTRSSGFALKRLASGAKCRRCLRANSMEDCTSSGLRSVM